MVDGLARLLAPILPVTADELWRVAAGRRAKRRCTWPCSRRDVDAWQDDALVERWARLIARARRGERRSSRRSGRTRRSARSLEAQGRDRRRAARRWRCSSDYDAELADAVHRLGDRGAGRRRTQAPELAVEVRPRPTAIKCERCWRYVPTVSSRAGVRRPVRPLRRRAGGAGERGTRWHGVGGRMPRSDAAPLAARRRPRSSRGCRSPSSSLDQITKALVRADAAAARQRSTVIPGLPGPDARAQHRRRVRLPRTRSTSPTRPSCVAVLATVGAGRRRLLRGDARAPRPAGRALGAGADPRRRHRQPDRSRRRRGWSSTSSTSTGGLALLGVQRRRRGITVGAVS